MGHKLNIFRFSVSIQRKQTYLKPTSATFFNQFYLHPIMLQTVFVIVFHISIQTFFSIFYANPGQEQRHSTSYWAAHIPQIFTEWTWPEPFKRLIEISHHYFKLVFGNMLSQDDRLLIVICAVLSCQTISKRAPFWFNDKAIWCRLWNYSFPQNQTHVFKLNSII